MTQSDDSKTGHLFLRQLSSAKIGGRGGGSLWRAAFAPLPPTPEGLREIRYCRPIVNFPISFTRKKSSQPTSWLKFHQIEFPPPLSNSTWAG